MLRSDDYVAWPLVREIYDRAAPSLVAQPPRVWRWPPRFKRCGVFVSYRPRPPIRPIEESAIAGLLGERFYLLQFARWCLADKSAPAESARPGDYLQVPRVRLRQYGLPAAAMGATAVWMHGTVNDENMGQTLVALVGSAEYHTGRYELESAAERSRSATWGSLRGSLPFPSAPADLGMLLRELADGEGLTSEADVSTGSPAAIAALAQRLTRRLTPVRAAGTALSQVESPDANHRHREARWEVMARVLVRQPGALPFSTIIVGIPLWVTRITPRLNTETEAAH